MTTTAPAPDLPLPDLLACDREPIQIPGSVQPHGAMLVLEQETLEIVQSAGSTERCLGRRADQLAGAGAASLFSEEQLRKIEALRSTPHNPSRPVHIFNHTDGANGFTSSVTGHPTGGLIILELEESGTRRNSISFQSYRTWSAVCRPHPISCRPARSRSNR